jgi:hypothetical protein
LWDISPPATSSSGMQLNLEHTVRDQVRSNYVRIDLFLDDACSNPIPAASNNFLVVDVLNDLTAFGDGSGTREVRLFVCLFVSRLLFATNRVGVGIHVCSL